MSFAAFQEAARNRSAEQVTALRERVKKALVEVVGKRYVQTDPLILDTYAWQYVAEAITGSNYMGRPLAVVLPADTAEVAAVVKACIACEVQFKATSTGFGAWNAHIDDDWIVQIDLRRLNRIVRIDEKNMYAVVEPYVTGNQLQTEAFKLGLNTHIAGCGAQCSILAAATSMMGQGWDGVYMGFSGRNLLGCEWVTAEGEIVQVGSFDAAGDDFCGDGPGFSLRGTFRGFGGALGGLGVFTRAAVKLYPWPGPTQLKQQGTSPEYYVDIPENHAAAMVLVDGWRNFAELGYRLGEAEICAYLGRNAPSLMAGTATVDNEECAKFYAIPVIHEMYFALIVIIAGANRDDFNYKTKVLKQILRELGGGMMMSGFEPATFYWLARLFMVLRKRIGWSDLFKSVPGFARLYFQNIRKYGLRKGFNILPMMMYQSLLRSNMNMRGVFRFGGSFWTAMGALVSWDNAIRGARVGAQVKQKYIDEKVILDDGGDNAWGGLYEAGAYAHLEELCCYDPTDENCRKRVLDYILETNLAVIDHHCGDSLNAMGPGNHFLYGPHCGDYDRWQQGIKKALDPGNHADASLYTDPNYQPNEQMQQSVARVMSNRVPITMDEVRPSPPVIPSAPEPATKPPDPAHSSAVGSQTVQRPGSSAAVVHPVPGPQ